MQKGKHRPTSNDYGKGIVVPVPYNWEDDDYLEALKRASGHGKGKGGKIARREMKRHFWTVVILVTMMVVGVALGVALGVTLLWAVSTYRGEIFDLLD